VAFDDDGSDDNEEEGAAAAVERRHIMFEYERRTSGQLDGGAFADLNAELAGEELDQPEKAKRKMFHRRAKGTTAAPR
jgi:hypothetical protein